MSNNSLNIRPHPSSDHRLVATVKEAFKEQSAAANKDSKLYQPPTAEQQREILDRMARETSLLMGFIGILLVAALTILLFILG